MFWEHLLLALVIIGVVGIVCMAIWLGAAGEQKKRETELAVARHTHLERMAMIERGIVPTTKRAYDSDRSRALAYRTLGAIGTASPVFAWLSHEPVAWISTAIIGTTAAIGVVIVYLPGSSCSDDDNADDIDEEEDEIGTEEPVPVVVEEIVVEEEVAESPAVESGVTEEVEPPVSEEPEATPSSGEEKPAQE